MLTPEVNRRTYLTASGAAIAVCLAPPGMLGQETRTSALLQLMSTLTGAKLQPQWVDPTSELVSAIVDISAPLRSVDLGEIEPATTFFAR